MSAVIDTPDDQNAIGSLGRQEILTFLILTVFVGFIIIVGTILFLILSNPDILKSIVISGTVDIGKFVEQFQSLIPAFLTLLGVGVGGSIVSKVRN